MPFGLKNARATYQKLANQMFEKQIGATMEVYIDDMLVKSMRRQYHVDDLRETVVILEKYNMTLNPSKCTFDVTSGKFLGSVVTQRGIDASQEQIKAIMNLVSPRNVKEVQTQTGRVVALNRFISKSSDKCRLFYNVLRNNKGLAWTNEHEEALNKLKKYPSTPPLLSKPKAGEALQLYLAV